MGVHVLLGRHILGIQKASIRRPLQAPAAKLRSWLHPPPPLTSSEAAKEAVYLKRFAEELEISDGSPLPLHGDNKGARDLAYNPEHHQRSKHIDRHHFYVRETIEHRERRTGRTVCEDGRPRTTSARYGWAA